MLSITFFYSKIHLFILKVRVTDREIVYPLIYSLDGQSVRGRPGRQRRAKHSNSISHMGGQVQICARSSAALLSPPAKSWMKTGRAGTQTGTNMAWQCCRRQLYLLCHNSRPWTSSHRLIYHLNAISSEISIQVLCSFFTQTFCFLLLHLQSIIHFG